MRTRQITGTLVSENLVPDEPGWWLWGTNSMDAVQRWVSRGEGGLGFQRRNGVWVPVSSFAEWMWHGRCYHNGETVTVEVECGEVERPDIDALWGRLRNVNDDDPWELRHALRQALDYVAALEAGAGEQGKAPENQCDECENLKRILANLIPWVQQEPGPDWASPEAKQRNREMCERALNEACDVFPVSYGWANGEYELAGAGEQVESEPAHNKTSLQWLRKMTKAEDEAGCVSVGGLLVEMNKAVEQPMSDAETADRPDVEAIRKRHEAATEGPWYEEEAAGGFDIATNYQPNGMATTVVHGQHESEMVGVETMTVEDRHFIAHSWQDVSTLLQWCERLERENQRLRSETRDRPGMTPEEAAVIEAAKAWAATPCPMELTPEEMDLAAAVHAMTGGTGEGLALVQRADAQSKTTADVATFTTDTEQMRGQER